MSTKYERAQNIAQQLSEANKIRVFRDIAEITLTGRVIAIGADEPLDHGTDEQIIRRGKVAVEMEEDIANLASNPFVVFGLRLATRRIHKGKDFVEAVL